LSPAWIRSELECSPILKLMGSCAGLWPLEYWKVRNWHQNKLYGSNRRIFDLDYYRHCRAGYGR
jgi:hypothetical protein